MARTLNFFVLAVQLRCEVSYLLLALFTVWLHCRSEITAVQVSRERSKPHGMPGSRETLRLRVLSPSLDKNRAPQRVTLSLVSRAVESSLRRKTKKDNEKGTKTRGRAIPRTAESFGRERERGDFRERGLPPLRSERTVANYVLN